MQMNIPFPLARGVVSLFLATLVAGGCGTVSKDTETNSTEDASMSDTNNDTTGTDTDDTDASSGSAGPETDSGDTDFPNCPDGSVAPGSGENLMEEYGRPCEADSDCDDLGEDAKCVKTILEVAHAPAGYCSRDCDLPDGNTKYVEEDEKCGPGLTCLGVMGFFEACAPQCTSDDQCQREGYECRLLPVVGAENEPTFCLMVDECVASDAPPP